MHVNTDFVIRNNVNWSIPEYILFIYYWFINTISGNVTKNCIDTNHTWFHNNLEVAHIEKKCRLSLLEIFEIQTHVAKGNKFMNDHMEFNKSPPLD